MRNDPPHPFGKIKFDTNWPFPPIVYYWTLIVGIRGAIAERADDANAVFTAIEPLVDTKNPWNERTYEYHRCVAMGTAGDTAYALRRMTERLKNDPDDDIAKLMMATAMRNAGDPEWESIAHGVIATSIDQFARAVARAMVANQAEAKKRLKRFETRRELEKLGVSTMR